MIGFLMGTKLGRMVGLAFGAIVAFILFAAKFKAEGRKEAYHEMQDKDRKGADAIRDRVRDAKWVRPGSITYRD